MIAQPSLFDAPPSELDTRFQAFHRKHPEVYTELRRVSLYMKRRGWKKASLKRIVEDVRWDSHIPAEKDGPFKIDNSLVSRYVRLLMEREPELRGFFETRRLAS